MGDQVRVVFPLERDEDGWPPYEVEVVWADRTESADEVLLTNILAFAPWISLGDRIRVSPRDDGRYQFERLIEESGHSTVRIWTEVQLMPDICDRLIGFGCEFEIRGSGFLGVDVPPETNWLALTQWLQAEWAAERLGYEEGAISTGHRAQRG